MALSFPRDWPERAPLLEVFTAALDAVDPERAVGSALAERPLAGPATVIAIGKAAPAMVRAVPQVTSGVVVSDHSEPVPDGLESFIGGHPLPDERSQAAGDAVVAAIDRSDGPILFLISGGSSALCEIPAAGLSIEDVATVTASLLRSGADIDAMNTVRKHLSAIKGGRLAERVGQRQARSLLVSDVVGDSVETIGSGPTVPDPTTYVDAVNVLDRYRIGVPEVVSAHLAKGVRGELSETPVEAIPGHAAEVVANAAVAATAAAGVAAALGMQARVETTELGGDAEEAATIAVASDGQVGMTFYAGETTVEVTGGGVGGRNQHAALAAALALDGGDNRMLFGALATDGVDGPTDGAGAVVDAGTLGRGRAAGLDAASHLRNHDSHPFLEATGDLLRIGPSGTNVGDLWVVWRR